MKYLLLLMLLTGLNCFGQDYNSHIATHRKAYLDDFLTDKNSPLNKNETKFIRFYDPDSSYRVEATVELVSNATSFIMPVFSGTGREYVKYALLKFVLQGKPMELNIYKSKSNTFSDYLFLPFTDETNGTETYAGGRYLDFKEGDIKSGKVVVDFNKAYNPYCAYSDGYACPKPPDENQLKIAVKVGERMFAGAKKH